MKKALSLMLALILTVCSINLQAYTETSDSDVAARVEQLRNDPVIHEMVEKYAPDPEKWWAWFEERPLEGSVETGVGKIYVLEWIKAFASFPEEQRLSVSYNPLLFAVTGPEDSSKSKDMNMITAKICGAIPYVKRLIATLTP